MKEETLEQPESTRMMVAILLRSRLDYKHLFATRPDGLSLMRTRDDEPIWEEMFGHVPKWNEEDKDLLRCVMGYTCQCAKRIANWQHDDTIYPSAEYLMHSLPVWLRSYFPDDCNWQAQHIDRNTRAEFTYHPAPTDDVWKKKMDKEWGACLKEVPWYDPEWSEDEEHSWCSDDSDQEETDDSDQEEETDGSDQQQNQLTMGRSSFCYRDRLLPSSRWYVRSSRALGQGAQEQGENDETEVDVSTMESSHMAIMVVVVESVLCFLHETKRRLTNRAVSVVVAPTISRQSQSLPNQPFRTKCLDS